MITETAVAVRYPDCDPMSIVHHAVYPVWYEIARMDYFQKLGFGYADMHALGIDPPMVDLHVQYKAAVSYPGEVTIRTRATFCAPKKLRLHYECFYEGQLVNIADTFHIWTGPDHRSLDLEQNLPDIYAKLTAAVEAEA
ncbi:MAG: acyl-CoA thioesterase [Oscillospiraceae bacterium]